MTGSSTSWKEREQGVASDVSTDHLSPRKRRHMKLSILVASTICITALVSIFTVAAWGQTKSSFQPGTIMEVKAHQSDSQSGKTAQQYDVSVKVGNIVYVVLYTPPAGSNAVEYRKG